MNTRLIVWISLVILGNSHKIMAVNNDVLIRTGGDPNFVFFNGHLLKSKTDFFASSVSRNEESTIKTTSKDLTTFYNGAIFNCKNMGTLRKRNNHFLKTIYINYLSEKIAILSSKNGRFAQIVNTKSMNVVSAHCDVAVDFYRVSENKRYVAFITKDIDKIEFINKDMNLWAPSYKGTMTIHLYDLLSNKQNIITYNDDDIIEDLLISGNGVVYSLINEKSTSFFSLRAVAGHPKSINTRYFEEIEPNNLDARKKWLLDETNEDKKYSLSFGRFLGKRKTR